MDFRSIQNRDRPLENKDFPKISLRYLYQRSSESRERDVEGQDYLVWRYTENAFDFVICDGVGGSFFGNIAAEYLGKQLIDYLLSDLNFENISNQSALVEKATKYLNAWRDGGQAKIHTKEFANLPSLQIQALEELRNDHGSETVFVCGHLVLASSPMMLFLIWMGDTEVQLFDWEGKRIEIDGEWKYTDRWSTKYGTRGRVHAWVGDIESYSIERIIAFSDGLSSLSNKLHKLQNDELSAAVDAQLQSPSSDDISFIDVRLPPPNLPEEISLEKDKLPRVFKKKSMGESTSNGMDKIC